MVCEDQEKDMVLHDQVPRWRIKTDFLRGRHIVQTKPKEGKVQDKK